MAWNEKQLRTSIILKVRYSYPQGERGAYEAEMILERGTPVTLFNSLDQGMPHVEVGIRVNEWFSFRVWVRSEDVEDRPPVVSGVEGHHGNSANMEDVNRPSTDEEAEAIDDS